MLTWLDSMKLRGPTVGGFSEVARGLRLTFSRECLLRPSCLLAEWLTLSSRGIVEKKEKKEELERK